MSTDTSAFAEAAKDSAKENGGKVGSYFADLSFDSVPVEPGRVAKALIKSRGSGQSIEDIQESLSCGRGPAHVIRGVERAAGIDTIPPVGEIVYGLYRTVRGGSGNAE